MFLSPMVGQSTECITLQSVDMSKYGAVWPDTFKDRTRAPRKHLTARADLIHAVNPGGSVVVAAPEYLGLSKPDAQWFVGELAARGVRLIVNGGSVVIAPGEETTELAGTVARFQKAQHMRR